MIRYSLPRNPVLYDRLAVAEGLAEAKAAVFALTTMPYQRRWIEDLQEVQLKREVAGTSRIEGAEFTEGELAAALRETPETLFTRSQRQAHAAMRTYRWVAQLPVDVPVTERLIRDIHARLVAGADDDHCPPGKLRERDQNVVFGVPQHRGAEGGPELDQAFSWLTQALAGPFQEYDPLLQALAVHYHLAAIHPFLDGNGRTARAIEAVYLRKAGLKDLLIAMSNYYYDEKTAYLKALGDTQAGGHDLTPFLLFGLKGVAQQCRRLNDAIAREVRKALFRNLMYELFSRLFSTKKRVLAERQIEILKLLLERESVGWQGFLAETKHLYRSLKSPGRAVQRDLEHLLRLGAVAQESTSQGELRFRVNLDWPEKITETRFFELLDHLPRSKTLSFLGDRFDGSGEKQ